jgi:hypothetical protein
MTAFLSTTGDFSASYADAGTITMNRNGLIGEFLFHRNFATSRINTAGAKAVSTAVEVVGNGAIPPVYGDHQVQLGDAAGFDTGIAMPTGAQTIVLVCSMQAVDGTALSSNALYSGRSAQANGALNIQWDATYGHCARLADTTTTTAVLSNLPQRPLTGLRCLIASLSGSAQGSTLTYGEYGGGALLQQATAPLAVARSVAACDLVTGCTTGIAVGAYPARVLYTARLDYNRELSAAEKLGVYQELRALLAPWKAI